MEKPKTTERKQWDVVLPDDSFVVQQWLVRDGSAVQAGEKVAIAIKGSTDTGIRTSAVMTHKRPKKRQRVQDTTKEQQEKTAPDTETKRVAAPQSKSISSSLAPRSDKITITAPAAGILRLSICTQDHALVIGTIEPCPHPAIMDGLCAVCGASILHDTQQQQQQQQQQESANTLSKNETMSQVTVAGGVTMTISETEARIMSKQTCQRLLQERKLSLVLDLDHTLVHATADARARSHYHSRPDVRTLILPVQVNPTTTLWMQHYVKLRPHVKEFLESLGEEYEIYVYTAGTRIYAQHVCMLLSRTIVGATRDEDDLQRLRHAVSHAEYQLAHKQANQTKNDTFHEKEKERDDTESTTTTTTTTNGTKKKKVSFGEPPKETKTDEMTLERLTELKQELQEAEALEQEALNVRQLIFGSRIVSRTDVGDLGRDVKSLERIFPGGGSMALIVDDREDVWANAQDNSKTRGEPPDNLLLIRPYHWKPFLGFADVNNAAGDDISGESTTTEDEEDCALLWTLDILKRMHKRFYTAIQETANRNIITVPPLIREMRNEVLEDCTLVYSGLIPLHQQNRTSSSPRPPVVRYGESLGATVKDTVDTTITHMVAARDGTDKIRLARQVPGCHVVKPSWLMECVWTMTRRDVTPHLLGKPTAITNDAPDAAGANESSSSDDDDDDDFAAMLEADMME